MRSATNHCQARYYGRTADLAPRASTLLGLKNLLGTIVADDTAIDLGSGAGRDLPPLLAHPWQVLAIDSNRKSCQMLRKTYKNCTNLNIRCGRIETVKFPKSLFINASVSLPFVEAAALEAVVAKIILALQPMGVFAGHFFGQEHSWRLTEPRLSFVSDTDVIRLFQKLEIISMKHHYGVLWSGENFHHITVIVRKPQVLESK